ncbi:hypothetical protein HGRIS_007873 [Hohenbuehelia grisea]
MSPAFGRTLQFITTMKLQELEKQRLAYIKHSSVLDEAEKAVDPIQKVEILLKGVRGWAGSGGINNDLVGGKLDLSNLDIWIQQSKKDPSFSKDIVRGWAETLESHLRHNQTRFDFAKLFGNLFNEWISSGDSVTAAPSSDDNKPDATSSESFVEVGRKEMLEQKERLQSIIFEPAVVDADSIRTYLDNLFSSDDSKRILKDVKEQLDEFSTDLSTRTFQSSDVQWAIQSVLAADLMNEEKRTTLKEFSSNKLIMDELASVLNMRLAGLSSWSWPEEGLTVEMKRGLNGKYRAFTDPDIVDVLLLQLLGILWQIEIKRVFQMIYSSSAWKPSIAPLSKSERERQRRFLGTGVDDRNIESYRSGIRARNFVAGQLATNVSSRSTYDDDNADEDATAELSAVQVKQQLIHMMSTDCHLNTALHGSHTVVRSDLEWFGPSLPHDSIFTVLSFFGISQQWLDFFKTFLRAPTRFKEEPATALRIRERGTPISYALSAMFGEAVLFVMDFAVNQKADGLFLYRIHDDLWLWDAKQARCEVAWEAMSEYATLVGLKFNEEKTGSACVKGTLSPKLPTGHVRWGFLRFDSDEARFIIDQAEVDVHIAELRRQLNATKSIFGWVNAYNKYMAFFRRNFGGRPPECFGRVLIDDMVDTFARIQRELFPDGASTGGAVGHLRSIINTRFGMDGIPEGYFYFPIAHGGLELRNPMIEVFALWSHDDDDDPREAFTKGIEADQDMYKILKANWDTAPASGSRWETEPDGSWTKGSSSKSGEFMSYEQYTAHRERTLGSWAARYEELMSVPPPITVKMTPALSASAGSLSASWGLDYYPAWVVALYGEELLKKFGTLEVVDPNLIPVGMVQLFKTSRMKWEQ